MSDHVYKIVEVTGSSRNTVEEAVERAVARTGESVHSLRWFQVEDIRGHLVEGKIDHWQVTVKIGFTVDD